MLKVISLLFLSSLCFANTAVKTTTTFANGGAFGANSWSISGGGPAYQFVDADGSGSTYLNCTSLGFTSSDIPTGSTINGITVEIEYYANVSSAGNRVNDFSVKILKGGTVTGDENARAGTSGFRWPLIGSKAYVSYGNSSYLWGTTWTQGDVTASNFGVAAAGIGFKGDGSEQGFIDSVRITVDFTPSFNKAAAFFQFFD